MPTSIGFLNDELPVFLGNGVNWATGAVLQSAITNVEEEPPSGRDAAKARYELYLLEAWSDITRRQSQEARASLAMGLFGGSASSANSLVQRTSAYSVRIVVEIDVELPIIALKRPNSEVSLTDVAEFVATYGTHFVLGRQRGASLIAIFSIATSTEEERQDLVNNIRLSGVLGGGSYGGSAGISESLERISGSRAITFQYQLSGPKISVSSDDWRTFLRAVDGFVGSVTQENSFNRRIWLEGYEAAKGFDGPFALKLRRLVLAQQRKLDQIAKVVDKIRERQAIILEVTGQPRRFTDADVAAMTNEKDEVDEALAAALREAEDVAVDPDHVVALPILAPFIRPKESSRLPPQPQVPRSPRLVVYSGRSKTGSAYEFTAPGANFAAEINDRMQSFEIVGDFPVNSWWITFYYNGNFDGPRQTFVAPCSVNVIASERGLMYRAFDISVGREVDIPLSIYLDRSSSVKIERNEDRSKLPPWFRPLD